MGRRKIQKDSKTEISSIDRAELNIKRTTKLGNKRKKIEDNVIDPGPIDLQKQIHSSSINRYSSMRLAYKRRIGESRKFLVVDEECEAVKLTRIDQNIPRENRRLSQFIFHDDDGKPETLEMLGLKELYISGLILPLEETAEQIKETKVRCAGFGPIESWAISGFDEGDPILWISTEAADYECLRAAAAYKSFYNLLYEKARACTLIYRKLSKTCGGDPNIHLNKLITEVACSMKSSGNFPQGVPIEPLIMSWGEFIHEQLIGLDETATEGDTIFNNLDVLLSLRDAGKWRTDYASAKLMPSQEIPYIKRSYQSSAPGNENEKDRSLKLARLIGEIETWKLVNPNKGQRSFTASQGSFLKSSEQEIAEEIPVPAFWNTDIKEADECDVFGNQSQSEDIDELPQRMLHNWSLYTTGSRFVSLEFLPMKCWGDNNVRVFGSGIMTAEFESGVSLETGYLKNCGTPIRLNEISEWSVEFDQSGVLISVETDNARYKLGKPSKQYAPWYEPVLKTAKLARSIITLLKEQSRVSRLTFQEAIKKVSEFGDDNPAHISSDQEVVETYVVDHGHMILQLFSNFPDDAIRRCSFVRALYGLVNEQHQTERLVKKKVVLNRNADLKPRDIEEPDLPKLNEISVTTTILIRSIYSRGLSDNTPKASKEDDIPEMKETHVKKEIKYNAGETFEEINEQKILCNKSTEIQWIGGIVGIKSAGEALYNQAIVHGDVVSKGCAVIVRKPDLEQESAIYLVEYMYEASDAIKMAHGRQVLKGSETILRSFANKREVFLTNICKDFELSNVLGTLRIDFQKLPCGDKHSGGNLKLDPNYSKKGPPCGYFSKSLYFPEKGSIMCLQSDSVGLGNGRCCSCEYSQSHNTEGFKLSTSLTHFSYEGVDYEVNDFLYLSPCQIAEDEGRRRSITSGRTKSLTAFVVCQLLEVKVSKPMEVANPESTIIKLRRFFRPEDISPEKAYESDIREVYYSKQELMVPITAVRGKCEVRRKQDVQFSTRPYIFEHVFFCKQQFDAESRVLKQLPPRIKLSRPKGSSNKKVTRKRKKGNCKGRRKGSDNQKSEPLTASQNFLTALDLFAGCGGLSEGLHQSDVSVTKWAIEADEHAGRAFQLNHPEATTIINNCNVILRAVMSACGKADDCFSSPETERLAEELDKEVFDRLPQPGQVDFIYGGPPCQGFSRLNRFTGSPWSVAQSVLILNFLSYVDVYRPKFVLIENVRHFTSFNKGKMFSFALASLIELGYQVRFGVLEAGAFGISQSRKRAFIWAATPGETLPEWPEPMHVFAGPDLKVTIKNNIKYAAVRSTASGAPFRSITVRDTIGDLPVVANGASAVAMSYEEQPISWFQKRVRGDMGVLSEHISKEMSELNLKRCQNVREPGHDWRNLPKDKIDLSNGRSADMVPQGVRNTAYRHNQWKGVYGRLDWEGHFPTTVTDPHPMHKVGRCFHPEQSRILTIREYARSQGFPDSYRFYGNIQDKHKQIGNAVPPPLAFALGRKLKEAIDKKQSNQ